MTSITGDVLSDMGTLGEHSVNLIFSDPPYNLGSEVVVDPADGKMKFQGTAKDFMGKWEFGHEQWEAFFREAYRIMKYGGYCVLFSLDRQTALVKYYAHLAGFEEQQSLYWYFCNDDQTELLTKRGFKRHFEIAHDDVVLTFNPKTNESEWQPIENLFTYDVKDESMVRISGAQIDQKVTWNHRVLLQRRSNPRYSFGDWEYVTADSLLEKKSLLSRFPISFPNNEGSFSIGEDYAELLGWVFTDGFYQKGDNSVRISQASPANDEKIRHIDALLTRLRVDFKRYEYEKTYSYKGVDKKYVEVTFYFNSDLSKQIRSKYPSKLPVYDLLDLPLEERRALLRGILGGDGYSTNGSGHPLYASLSGTESFGLEKNKDLVEFTQCLAQSLGYKTQVSKKKGKSTYVLSCCEGGTTSIPSTTIRDRKYVYREGYTGKVWSIQVANSNYAIRRNGKVSFTGNCSGFPKGMNIGKGVDKKLGLEREVVRNGAKYEAGADGNSYGHGLNVGFQERELTAPASDLAKKWDGYYAGIAPLKPSMETILVFRKPYARGNHVSNLMDFEAGDESISPSVVNIEGSRVGTNAGWSYPNGRGGKGCFGRESLEKNLDKPMEATSGRYPSQLYVDSGAAELLDAQSGVTKSGSRKAGEYQRLGGQGRYSSGGVGPLPEVIGDEGGCSRILHRCDYEADELELVYFASKVSRSERNAGLAGREKRPIRWSSGTQNPGSFQSAGTDRSAVNPHPSLKPLSLLSRIASLFRFPAGVPQSVYVPFAGTFSEVIGLQQAGYDMSLVRACEKSAEYVEIGRARYEYWSTRSVEKRQGKGTSKAVRAAKSAAEVDGAFCSDESEESA